jgi:hypothetical protein
VKVPFEANLPTEVTELSVRSVEGVYTNCVLEHKHKSRPLVGNVYDEK